MRTYIAIHKHEYGTSVRLFQSEQPADTIFNCLSEYEDDDAPEALTQADFAKRINLDFEPEKQETLEVQEFDPSQHEPVDFSDFA